MGEGHIRPPLPLAGIELSKNIKIIYIFLLIIIHMYLTIPLFILDRDEIFDFSSTGIFSQLMFHDF